MILKKKIQIIIILVLNAGSQYISLIHSKNMLWILDTHRFVHYHRPYNDGLVGLCFLIFSLE